MAYILSAISGCYRRLICSETSLYMCHASYLKANFSELLEEGDIYGLEEFLMGVEDERTREAVSANLQSVIICLHSPTSRS